MPPEVIWSSLLLAAGEFQFRTHLHEHLIWRFVILLSAAQTLLSETRRQQEGYFLIYTVFSLGSGVNLIKITPGPCSPHFEGPNCKFQVFFFLC